MNGSNPSNRLTVRLATGLAIVALAAGCVGNQSTVQTPPPQAPETTPPATVSPVIHVADDSSLAIGARKVKPGDVVTALRKAGMAADTEIRLVSAPNAPFNTVVAVMKDLKDHGFTRVNLIVEKAPTHTAK